MISAIDGDKKGNEAEDVFRIKIWEEDASGTESIIYDNEINAGDVEEADPTTTPGGGSIIVHDGNDKGK